MPKCDFNKVAEQPSRGVLRERCSKNMQQIYWRTTMPTCDFNKVATQNGQTHLNNSSATADEFFESVRPFYGVGA